MIYKVTWMQCIDVDTSELNMNEFSTDRLRNDRDNGQLWAGVMDQVICDITL